MQKTWKPTVAGVLSIVAGALILLFAFIISLGMTVAAPFRSAMVSVMLFSALYLGTGIVALVGGIFSLQRRHWGLSLAGAICALMPPATMLGIACIVFTALAREDFPPPAAPLPGHSESTPSQDGKIERTTESDSPSGGERNA